MVGAGTRTLLALEHLVRTAHQSRVAPGRAGPRARRRPRPRSRRLRAGAARARAASRTAAASTASTRLRAAKTTRPMPRPSASVTPGARNFNGASRKEIARTIPSHTQATAPTTAFTSFPLPTADDGCADRAPRRRHACCGAPRPGGEAVGRRRRDGGDHCSSATRALRAARRPSALRDPGTSSRVAAADSRRPPVRGRRGHRRHQRQRLVGVVGDELRHEVVPVRGDGTVHGVDVVLVQRSQAARRASRRRAGPSCSPQDYGSARRVSGRRSLPISPATAILERTARSNRDVVHHRPRRPSWPGRAWRRDRSGRASCCTRPTTA